MVRQAPQEDSPKSLVSFFEFLFVSKVESIQEMQHFGVDNALVV